MAKFTTNGERQWPRKYKRDARKRRRVSVGLPPTHAAIRQTRCTRWSTNSMTTRSRRNLDRPDESPATLAKYERFWERAPRRRRWRQSNSSTLRSPAKPTILPWFTWRETKRSSGQSNFRPRPHCPRRCVHRCRQQAVRGQCHAERGNGSYVSKSGGTMTGPLR